MFEGSALMAQIAVEVTAAAALIIPTAGPIAVDMYKGQCDPAAFHAGYEVWARVTTTLQDAAKTVEETIKNVSREQWSGKDREAFEESLKDYKSQIELAAFLSNAIAVILLTVAWALFIFVTIMAFVAGFLAALLLFIAAEAAVTLSFGYGPAVAEASSMVGSLYTGFWEPVNKALEVMLNLLAGILGGGLFVDIIGQAFSGNPGAIADFVGAQVPAIDVIWRGSLNRAERKVTADLMSGGLSTETTALPGIPKFTKLFPEPVGGVGSIKGTADTVNHGGPSLTSGLIGKDNDQVG